MCSYFRHISLCFYSNFDWKSSLEVELNFSSNKYPLDMILMGPTTPKTINNLKNMTSSCFFRYLLFLGKWGPSKVCRVGTRWMWNLIPHPNISLNRNLSKNRGRYIENTNKKVVFSFLPPKLINIILLF